MNDFKDDVVTLIKEMVGVFQKKKEIKQITKRIKRGRSSASSCEFEEAIASLIEKNTLDDIEILVDFPISYKLPHFIKAKTIYPDISLIRAGSLIGIVEAKIDLGYLSEGWWERRNSVIGELKTAGTVTVSRRPVEVRRVDMICVVLTERNDHGRLPSFRDAAGHSVFLMSAEQTHPNDTISDQAAFIEKVKVNRKNLEEWRTFEAYIRTFEALSQNNREE